MEAENTPSQYLRKSPERSMINSQIGGYWI